MLSKSDYMLFLRHPAWLWIKKYQKDLLPPVDANQQAIFDRGRRIEQYAEQRFANGTQLGFTNFQEYNSLPSRTREALANGATTLFQPRFEFEGTTCISDIVVLPDGAKSTTVHLYEVKSSTKVKEEHLYDLAFQASVLTGCGYMVKKVAVLHINTAYILDGVIDSDQLFTEVDVTESVSELSEKTEKYITLAKDVLERKTIPDPSPKHCRLGSFTDWLPIYESIVGESPVLHFPSLSAVQVAEIEQLGVEKLLDIPELASFSERQRSYWNTLRAGAELDAEGVRTFLDSLVYPLYFLDYETTSDAVPLYQGTRPYQQVCFQYSLHIVREPGAQPEHYEYLHTNSHNPIESLSASLKSQIGEMGSVLVWYADFEGSRNREMGEFLPEYAEFYSDINERMVDLMIPFSTGLVKDPRFLGSSSIKKVLPVLAPDLSYGDLTISEGETAQRRWTSYFIFGERDNKEKLVNDLLVYCKLDTLAMVKIWEWLEAQVGN